MCGLPSTRSFVRAALAPAAALVAASGCAEDRSEGAAPMAEIEWTADGQPSPLARNCDRDDGGLELPEGFCAILVASDIPGARHLEISPQGDIFLAREDRDEGIGGVTVLRDSDGDGRADQREDWPIGNSDDLLIRDGYLYVAHDDAVERIPLRPGSLLPAGPADTIVAGLPDSLNHSAKTIAFGPDGDLYVAIGAHGNACMTEMRTLESPGMDPCPLLDRRGGVWRFRPDATRQTQDDGTRFATGLRNTMAFAAHPAGGTLYGVMHGRDQLHELWPGVYDEEEGAENPAEEMFRIEEGRDYGWPYCYFDARAGRKVLAPEYGGDGTAVGRCDSVESPLIGFPAHWAPNDLAFYVGSQFPSYFRGGAFIAFHGSWNRAPLPQDGYYVVFVPMVGDSIAGDWSVFADGFLRTGLLGERRTARPVGVAVGPDGSLYVADSTRGRVWRIIYVGGTT